ncbi:RNA helicase [Malassezia japonica]|uniref:ATP-dependent RNA helicase n=1 Tax=Malassezia japonica TaxID=223818 RepID=A0AAF0F0U5_9BASI|nr:RNA helicase [Malassezia japonica]WFD40683.1 RNA helicase [Malassezia japonica]
MPGAARGGKSKVFNGRTRASRTLKRTSEQKELADIEAACATLEPGAAKTFAELPASQKTKHGLKRAGFLDLTDIQSASLAHSLRGSDVLGAARTGSGKTLAFLIPVLEMLYRKRWSAADGLGALIVSPTRELAMQIFDVLRQIGSAHTFSAGLVIGGKELKHEQDRLRKMNILVATPGRLLQHLDQTIGFDCSNLQVLVLDEADRILDMGFANTLNAILEHLPPNRQTLLFSATQTRRVKDLARLSLQDPEYVAVKDDEASTPAQLEQFYMVVPLDQKLDTLFSFLRTHTQSKILVFMSSCRQVQYAHEVFCKLRPGLPLMALHGKQKQTRRLKIFSDFTRSKHAALMATDIAARGLDFPAVDWVVQVDAPDSSDTYIHRVGRTARYQAQGKGLLFLLPSEETGVLATLKAVDVPIQGIKARDTKVQSIQNQLQSFAFQEPELKHLAQKAFVSYVRSIHLHKDKNTFNVASLPLNEFAAALGLPGAPKIKLVKDAQKAQRAMAAAPAAQSSDESSSEESEEEQEEEAPKVRTKHDRLFGRTNNTILSDHYANMVDHDDSDGFHDNDDDDEFITLKRADHELEQTETPTAQELSKRKLLQGQSKKAMAAAGKRGMGDKVVFDDDGNARALYELQDEAAFREQGDVLAQIAAHEEQERARMAEADVLDKSRAKQKRQEKKRKMKEMERQLQEANGARAPRAELDEGGWASDDLPDLVLPGDSDEDAAPEPKRPRTGASDLAAQEALALQVLGES